MEATPSSETLADFQMTTMCYIPKDRILQTIWDHHGGEHQYYGFSEMYHQAAWIQRYQHFLGTYYLNLWGKVVFYPEDGGSRVLRKGIYQPVRRHEKLPHSSF
jgi:hypothetical protein